MLHFVALGIDQRNCMSEIVQAKYQFIFGGYIPLACAVGVVFELALIGLRDKNRYRSRPENTGRLLLLVLFAVLVTGLDYLRGFGVVPVPRFSNFTPIYRPEAAWYLGRAVVSTLAVVGFEICERAIRRKIARRSLSLMTPDSAIGETPQA
jgi:hypothetical protein